MKSGFQNQKKKIFLKVNKNYYFCYFFKTSYVISNFVLKIHVFKKKKVKKKDVFPTSKEANYNNFIFILINILEIQ